MTSNPLLTPHVEWFKNHWSLPGQAVPLLEQLLEAEGNGSTAVELPPDAAQTNCGEAAVVAKVGSAAPELSRPLVIVKSGKKLFLQSWLYYQAELEIAEAILQRAGDGFSEAVKLDQLKTLFLSAKADDLQVRAAEVALGNRLAIITGGPGTGKTHTLARILITLVESGVNASRIRLAAPTGKAADRMKKAVGESLENLPREFKPLIEDLVAAANKSSTLHALLGYNPSVGQCRYDESNPLSCEVLIIDECSMVDVLLWRAVLKATPQNARLILVGDPNQLESVGQGNVLAELVRVAQQEKSPLNRLWVRLTETRRFKNRPAIVALANALANLDAARAVQLLSDAKGTAADNGIAWQEVPEGALSWAMFAESIKNALESVAEAMTPQAALDALGKICILTAQREYFIGAKAMSQAIENHFAQHATAAKTPNQPIIINQNDPETGLRNGSVGVITTNPEGIRKAWFPGFNSDGSLREFSVAQLPDYSPAWALTIHRSQGSEFDEVLVILPREESPMTTRELIYTAITRARRTVHIVGNLESIRKAASNPSKRITLVGAHLEKLPQP